MPSKSFNENSENKTSLFRRTFVVGSGVEPLAHCFHTDALPMLSRPNNWATTTILFKELLSGFQTIWCSKLVTLTSGTFLLSSRFVFQRYEDFFKPSNLFFIFFEFKYRVSFITYKFQILYKCKIKFLHWQHPTQFILFLILGISTST